MKGYLGKSDEYEAQACTVGKCDHTKIGDREA
jgi:hypothetical protein